LKKRIIVNGEERFWCEPCGKYYPREEMTPHKGASYDVETYCKKCGSFFHKKIQKRSRFRLKSRCQPRESEGNYMVVRKSGICKNWFKPVYCRR